MALYGMDIENVRALAAKFTSSADEIRTLMNSLNGQIHHVDWRGPDHDKFLSNWDGQYVQQLRHVADALDHAATTAKNNAMEQERTSSQV